MNNKISVVITMILITTTAIFTVPSTVLQLSHAQNNDLQSTVLNIHNRERNQVGTSPLTWSDSLANDAQRYAQYLTTLGLGPRDVLPHATGTGQGENLSWGTPGFYRVDQGVQQWADEKSNYKGTPISREDFLPGVPMIGHYTQMVWKDTTQIGCGTASSSTLEVLVCRYSPPGNYIGQLPYNTGSSSANQAVIDEQSTFAPGQGNTAGVNTNEHTGGNNNADLGENNNAQNSGNNNTDLHEGGT